MKLCQNCGQLLAEEIISCPSCGSAVDNGRQFIDDYRIIDVLHEGYSSILCKAAREKIDEPVMIRIFTPQSGVDEKIANRLKQELEELKKLPENYFVRHLEIKKSSDGLWYRVSEWIDTESWAALLSSGCLEDYRVVFGLFYRITSILEGLHQIGHLIPHLILDDIMVFKGKSQELETKIDYKLSRFLDPELDQPGPMLKKLLACHPDILNNRPLDFRSDIWSLGKIFVELLSADHAVIDFQAKIDELPLPHEAAVLLKIMLADDPDLRPRSMAEVARTLARFKDKKIRAVSQTQNETAQTPDQETKRFNKTISLLTLIISILVVLGGSAWLYFAFQEKDIETILGDHANQYADSTAFVMAEYWLKNDEKIVYFNRMEGTAFLVDKEGYLLTNRHVACPWLEDSRMYALINKLRYFKQSPLLGYKIFLWFEGEKAFKRLPDLSRHSDSGDIYFLKSAFKTDGTPKLTIAGVARQPIKTRQIIKSPLKDDFAILKIDQLPEGLNPIPLDYKIKVLEIPRLSPVITLGFPLGSKTQAATVKVSVTTGHVRRTFENLIQVDTSIHRGNSGGPIIDIRGKVIGIASRVATDRATAPVPVTTLLSDMGMVLPITKAAAFLQNLKAGQVKWNGVLDLSIDTKLKKITDLADKGRWSEAKTLADKELELSFDSALVMAAGMMHFCSENYKGARRLFNQALSIDSENDTAKLMVLLIDWLIDKDHLNPYRPELLALDWRSSSEFSGYLAQILEGDVEKESALKGWYSEYEKSWLHYIVALMQIKQENLEESEELLKKAVLASDSEDWLFFMALAKLEQIQQQRAASLANKARTTQYQSEIEEFNKRVQKNRSEKAKLRKETAPLIARLKQDSVSSEDKQAILEKLCNRNKSNGNLLVDLIYYSAMNESWDQALQYARTFLEIKGRENAGRLSIGLLEPEILHNLGRNKEAEKVLKEYNSQIKDSWYRAIGQCLLTSQTEQALTEKAGESPENMLTAHTALGFWAEGSKDGKKAQKHYKEALGSYMDYMIEYKFAKERIKRLKQNR